MITIEIKKLLEKGECREAIIKLAEELEEAQDELKKHLEIREEIEDED